MANRIFKFIAAKKRKSAVQPISGDDICAFCGNPLTGSHLNASSKLSKPDGSAPLAVICSRCIDQLGSLSRLMSWYQCYFRDDDFWPMLAAQIRKRTLAELGTERMQEAIVELLVRLTKRACGCLAGLRTNGVTVCPKTGVSLSPPRIALVCTAPVKCEQMIVAGADVIGLPVQVSDTMQASLGTSVYGDLCRNHCNGDGVIADAAGLIVVSDGYFTFTEDVAVFYLVSPIDSIPNGVEIVDLG